jgi:hypothetical protein
MLLKSKTFVVALLATAIALLAAASLSPLVAS